MKTIVFLIWTPIHSIHRYLLIAQRLSELNIKSVFLDLAGDLQSIIKERTKELNLGYSPEYSRLIDYSISHNKYPNLLSLLKNILMPKILRKYGKVKPELFNYKLHDSCLLDSNYLAKLTSLLHFNNNAIIEEGLKTLVPFRNSVQTAENFLEIWSKKFDLENAETKFFPKHIF